MRMGTRSEIPTFEPSAPLVASAYPEDLGNLAAGLSDEQALKKIGQRTTMTGKLLALLMVGGAGGMAYFYMQSSNAYEHRMDGVLAAGNLQGDAMLAALRAELAKSTYDDVKERAIRNLSHFKDVQAVPQLTAALDTPGIVRRAAALALANLGSPAADSAKPKLLAVLPTSDEKDRTQVVWALAVLREPSASDAILEEFTRGHLQAQPDFDPQIITKVLGIPKLSSPELTGHKEMSVRALVAMALSEAASPEVVAPLVRLIQNPDENDEVVRAAVAGLGRAGDPSAAAPLFALMQKRPAMRQSVLDALAKATAAPQLAVLLKQAHDVSAKRDLTRLLRKTYDLRAADTLALMAADPDEDVKQEAAHGLAELGDERAVPVLSELAKSEEDEVATDAVDALRRLGNPKAGPVLLEMFDKAPQRKASIMRALGATHTMEAGPKLMKELKGDDVGAASKGLGQMPYEKAYSELLGILPRSKYKGIDFSKPSVPSEMAYRNRLEAMGGLAYFGRPDPKLVKSLGAIIEDPEDDFRLAEVAGATLGLVADGEVYKLMLQKIMDVKLDERIRTDYATGLWRKPNPEVAAALLPLLSGETPAAIKTAAALAIGYAGSADNDAKLLALLDDPSARRYAAFAVVLGGNEDAARKLLEILPKDRDTEEVLRLAVSSNADDNFNLLTKSMFDSGQIFRRLRVAEIMMQGTGGNSYSYLWAQVTARLRSGWEGAGGMSDRDIRNTMYKELGSADPKRRALVANTLLSMNLRGLLLAARDAGVKEARDVLLNSDRPKAEVKN
ncbi:MAG: HEAT repeat domain-containing protein [Polyangiales bacterium]